MKFDFTIEQMSILSSILSNLKDSLEYQDRANCWVNNDNVIAVLDSENYQTFQEILKKFDIE